MTYREPLYSPIKTSRKLAEGEIMPCFDCIYCCKEHFVLGKLSECILTKKYGSIGSELDLLYVNMEMQHGPSPLEPIPEQICESLDFAAVIAMNKQPHYLSYITKGYLAHLKSNKEVLPRVQEQMFLGLHN